ncbi:MAG: MBL fold metallo-hydrolase [Planctomycetaceae bacterium]|nr:MBL fold metallo-hydrolase [Planctomycetales bacterium]MCB9937197.1 MBL fold metallo-hydrolase [Planctomycetaceae bacterium]
MLRLTLFCILLASVQVLAAESISSSVTLERGPVNSVLVEQDGKRLAVYGASSEVTPKYELLLLTHHRRDVLCQARTAITAGASAVAPEAERELIEKPTEYWNAFTANRFHDYAQQSTKVLSHPLEIDRWVKEGNAVEWHGLLFDVVETPGYTRGAVSYIATIDDRRMAFTGDLIYGDGQLLDLYSFQDEIPEANIRGYHGYGSRLAQLVTSLRKIADAKPDLIVPARGPIIEQPQVAIEKLITRVQALYRNYLSTNALHWYFKEERMRMCGERVLGPEADIELMPYSLHEKTPDWVFEHATSRLLISDDGHGFLLDCGYQRVIDAVKTLMTNGLVKQVDGIFVTHYHDDHTDMVQAAAEEFDCPVYATTEYTDILENPAAYHMPAMTSNAIKNIKSLPSGETMKWQEFELTFEFFPGQTHYHGALLARRQDERPIFFIGDAFAPSGIDDYCVLNRNLVHKEGGFRLCFQKLRQIDEPFWLVNEHIPYVFEFSDDEMDYLELRYEQRIEILQELFPWDAPNYGIDEQWAVFYPYGAKTTSGESLDLEVRITNHSPTQRTFVIEPRLPEGITLIECQAEITLTPGQSGVLPMKLDVKAIPGNYVITSDVVTDGMAFGEWVESLVTVE